METGAAIFRRRRQADEAAPVLIEPCVRRTSLETSCWLFDSAKADGSGRRLTSAPDLHLTRANRVLVLALHQSLRGAVLYTRKFADCLGSHAAKGALARLLRGDGNTSCVADAGASARVSMPRPMTEQPR